MFRGFGYFDAVVRIESDSRPFPIEYLPREYRISEHVGMRLVGKRQDIALIAREFFDDGSAAGEMLFLVCDAPYAKGQVGTWGSKDCHLCELETRFLYIIGIAISMLVFCELLVLKVILQICNSKPSSTVPVNCPAWCLSESRVRL